jgi:putative transposase
MHGVYLKGLEQVGNNFPKKKAYSAVLAKAEETGWNVGTLSSAYRYLEKINPLLVKYATGGRQALDNVFYIPRNYYDLWPFEVIVGDQHIFDFWVQDVQTGEVFRPMSYFFIDARTRIIYGFAFSGKTYNRSTIGNALRMGLVSFGLFKTIYTDNGKPEIAEYTTTIAREVNNWGAEIRDFSDFNALRDGGYAVLDEEDRIVDIAKDKKEYHKKAKAYNAKAKLIERFFRTLEGILIEMGTPGAVNDLSASNEVQKVNIKRLKSLADKDRLYTYEEFIAQVFKAATRYNNTRHSYLKKTPVEELIYSVKNEGFEFTFLEDMREIDLLLNMRATRKTHRGRVRINNMVFEGKSMDNGLDSGLWHIPDGTMVDVRYNPFDPNEAFAILANGEVRELRLVEHGSMVDGELTSRLNKKKSEYMKKVIMKYREYVSSIPDVVKYSKVKRIERKRAEVDYEEKITKDEILARVKENSEHANKKIVPLPAQKKVITSEIDKYEDILIRLARGEQISSFDIDFKKYYESRMSEEERESWDVWKRMYFGSEAVNNKVVWR